MIQSKESQNENQDQQQLKKRADITNMEQQISNEQNQSEDNQISQEKEQRKCDNQQLNNQDSIENKSEDNAIQQSNNQQQNRQDSIRNLQLRDEIAFLHTVSIVQFNLSLFDDDNQKENSYSLYRFYENQDQYIIANEVNNSVNQLINNLESTQF